MFIKSITEATAEWTKGKKITILSIVGCILILTIVAFFVPNARDYATSIVKILLDSIKTFVPIL